MEERIKEEARKFPELRIIGPNCLGILVPAMGLNASFAAAMPDPGHIAFISQSGALCTAILDWAERREVHVVFDEIYALSVFGERAFTSVATRRTVSESKPCATISSMLRSFSI